VEVSASTNFTFTVSGDRSLAANFANAYVITTLATPANGGTTIGDGTYNAGTSVTVVANASPGYAFLNWTANGNVVSLLPSYGFTATADLSLVANFSLNGTSVTFDFDTGNPLLHATMGATPMDQTVGGLTAHFSSPTVGAQGFSVQSDATTQFHLSQFSGNYLYPNSVYNPALEIQFSQPLTGITFTFATADFQQVEVPSTVRLTAFTNSTATPSVGSATAHGTYAGDTMPMGTLSFTSGVPFDVVRIEIPPAPRAASDFLVDNLTVTTAAALPPTLAISPPAGRIVTLSWPVPAPGWQLQESANLGGMQWVPVTNAVVVAQELNLVTLDMASGARFYRLAHP